MPDGGEAPRGRCYLLSFPFWVFVNRRERLPIREIEYLNRNFRVYPPFRSAPINWVPMPAIRAERIPSRRGVPPLTDEHGHLPRMSAYPHPAEDQNDGANEWAMFLAWGEEGDDPPDWYYPMDSLRVDVWGHEEVGGQVLNFTRALVDQLRLGTNQWWLGRSVAPFLTYHRNTVPVTVNGRVAGGLEFAAAGRTGRGDESAVDRDVWNSAISSVEEGDRPPAYKLQLLDARYSAATGDVRGSVLESAIACEDAIRLTYERLWPEEAPSFSAGRVMEGSGPPDYLSEDLQGYVRRSYEDEHPDSYEIIEDLWDARGNIAHGREPVFRRNGEIHQVDEEVADSFEQATERCIRWLEELERER